MVSISKLKAKDVMRTDVAAIAPEDTIENALELFEESKISGAPVINEHGDLVGVLTLSDVARTEHTSDDRIATQRGTYDMAEVAGEEREDELDADEVFYTKDDYSAEMLGRERVVEWMTREVISVTPDTSLEQVCRVMAMQHIHRVFVTEHKKLVGVISTFDVVRCIAGEPVAPDKPKRRVDASK